MKRIYTGLFCCCVFSIQSFSQTWNGSQSNDWNNALNWTPNNVPTTSGNVIINTAPATYQPVLPGNISIRTLTMTAGFLNLDGHTLTCSVSATLTGDSLYNGKISSATFNDLANMHMGGKIILDKTGASNEFWQGKNKFHGDSLIIIWKSGALHLENAASSPDSIFGNMKVQLTNDYSVLWSLNSKLYVQNNLILDNSGNGTFSWLNANDTTIINGNIVCQNFSSLTPNIYLKNLIALGNNFNGPFYSHTATIDNCNFNGDLTLVADSNVTINITNSSFLGANNLLQAGSVWAHDNQFGRIATGTSIVRAAYNGTDGSVRLRGGNNKFFGSAQWETFATYPGGVTIEHNYYGNDTTLDNLNFVLKGNASLVTNTNGNNYVGGNLIIDGQGARKWVQFTGGTGNSFNIGGSFTVKNFTPFCDASWPTSTPTNVHLRNITALGTDTCGTFYCYTGDINNCNFNGNFKLIADSSQGYDVINSSFLGADNLFQALGFNAHDNVFGKQGMGTTILRAANNTASSIFTRYGNNKYLNNLSLETYAVWPGGVTIQQNYYGKDSCLGNLDYILKGNASLGTNSNGHNYVGGNVVIDGQGARKWIQFDGGTGNSYNIGGSFTVKNFTPFCDASWPSSTPTNVHLRNVTALGNDTVGTFYCYTGDINNCNFNGNFKLIADSSQGYDIINSSFLGTDNLFQALGFNAHDNVFGKQGTGTTILRAANNTTSGVYTRYGNNKYLNNLSLETYAVWPGGVTIQQNYYGKDSCLGNLDYVLKGNASLGTNSNGRNYVGGNVVIDGQGARKWIQFDGGTNNTFTIGGSFTAKNFTPYTEIGIPPGTPTNVHLRNVTALGNDTVGTFYCYTGDVTSSSFNGNFKLIADSSQPYYINNSFLLGANNLLRAGNLDIQNSKFGKTTGTTILDVAHNVGAGVYVRDGGNKFFGDLIWNATSPSYGSMLVQQTYYGADTVLGNFALNVSGYTSADIAGGGGLYLGKGLSIQNNGTGTIAQSNGVPGIRFIGTDTTSYSYSGTGSAPSFIMIEMNRRGGLRLLSPLTYRDYLVFTRGIILSSSSNPVIVPATAVVIGAWDSSYVDGPVKRIGNTVFTFPLGKSNVYAPLSITAPSSATDAFTAQYFNHLAHVDGYDSTQHDPSLNHLSRREYWTLDRTNGTSSLKVTLSWKLKRSGIMTVIPDLRVARWNGSTWKDEGIGTVVGSSDEGTIQSRNDITSFSPFTLASTSSANAALPVKFLYFKAQLNANRTVLLEWKTAEEINNDHFEVQRSSDGIDWITLQTILPIAGGNYSYIDLRPFSGIDFYRVKQVDFNGDVLYTEIKMIKIVGDENIYLWPNPVVNELHMQLPFSKGVVEIADGTGKIVITKIVDANNIIIPVAQLSAGTYFVRIKTAGELYIRKFVKI